jgi:5'-phosphate synthase pdxT subunit
MVNVKVGVLAVQGAFAEHIAVLRKLGADAVPVRLPAELAKIDGLIIPGGESTTIDRLMRDYGLKTLINEKALAGMPVWGTCAGMILLARELTDNDFTPLGLIDITVTRNAFGRQKESFEIDLDISALGAEPFPAVFIRAPLIERAGEAVEILARLDGDGTIVAARQDNILVTAFHPELTADLRFHKYFAGTINNTGNSHDSDILLAHGATAPEARG